VRIVDLVVAIGADHQKVRRLLGVQQATERVERRGIGPLKIIEEDRQRMRFACEGPEEPGERHLESMLGLDEAGRRRGRLTS
jgi:hypothetical protein